MKLKKKKVTWDKVDFTRRDGDHNKTSGFQRGLRLRSRLRLK